jgi:uncharacterized protein YabE (DUF348 family)
MRKFTTTLGLAAALIAGAVSVVTIAPLTPTVDGNPQLIGCADTDSDALESADSQQRNCQQTRPGEGSIASI